MSKKEIFHPVGPVGSLIIGVLLFFAAMFWMPTLMWLAIAFFFGGFIMLTVRLINANKTPFDKS